MHARRAAILAGGGVKPYLGQIASHSGTPNSFAAPNKQFMTRTRHVSNAAVKSVQLVFANWTGDELTTGADATITASVEYPAGTFTQVLFSGSASGTIIDGSYIVSDGTSVTIPKGAVFWVRSYYTNTAGIPYAINVVNIAAGEGSAFGASGIADQTMGGTVPTSGGVLGYPCAGIIGLTTAPSFCILGDSRAAGTGDTLSGTSSGNGEIARSLGDYSYINAGVPGSRASGLVGIGASSKRIYLASLCSHVVSQFGINDLGAGRTPAQLLADHLTIKGYLAAGTRFYACTVEPRSTSTDGWATTVNQTTHASNAQRVSYNNLLRAGGTGLTGYLELADSTESARDSGLWKAPGYTADGLHASQTGYAAIQNSGAINPAIL